MEIAGAILLLIATLWASLSAKASAFENINKRRDILLTGRLDGKDISPEHRLLIYESDWRPLAWGATIASALFGFVAVLIPFLISDAIDRRPIAIVCWLVAGYHVIGGFITLLNMRKERRMIERFLTSISL